MLNLIKRAAILSFSLLISLAAAAAAQTDDLAARLTTAAAENRYAIMHEGDAFAGPGFDKLLAEGKAAQFFLIGEEHGVAENPKLAAALFETLAGDGYRHFAIEISPPMASVLDVALREDGLDGLRALYAQPGGEPAFFGMKEEAEMLAAVRSAVSIRKPVLWGVDYAVTSDQYLLGLLADKRKPRAAADALAALKAASDASWAQYFETRNPQFIFSFSGDPALVKAVRDAWPRRDAETGWILDTLEETLAINRDFVSGKGFQSNQRRADLIRGNFLRHWRAAAKPGDAPKIMAKMGANHLIRGRNYTETFDLGSLLPEMAAAADQKTFSLLVLPGPGAMTAVFDPTDFSFRAAPGKDGYERGLGPLYAAAPGDGFALIDLRPLRPLLGGRAEADPALKSAAHGFDMVLIMNGSTPSSEFEHPPAPGFD